MKALSVQVLSCCVYEKTNKMCNACMATFHTFLTFGRFICSSPSTKELQGLILKLIFRESGFNIGQPWDHPIGLERDEQPGGVVGEGPDDLPRRETEAAQTTTTTTNFTEAKFAGCCGCEEDSKRHWRSKMFSHWMLGSKFHWSFLLIKLENTHPENIHLLCKWKYNCTADLLFDWFGLGWTSKSVVE